MSKKKSSVRKGAKNKTNGSAREDSNIKTTVSAKETINTATESICDHAAQIKGRAQDGKIRGVLTMEFGVDAKDTAIRQAGAMSPQEVAFSTLLLQQMIVGSLAQKGVEKQDAIIDD